MRGRRPPVRAGNATRASCQACEHTALLCTQKRGGSAHHRRPLASRPAQGGAECCRSTGLRQSCMLGLQLPT
jgi:hypothetical protein